jgi:peroxiredoxin
MPRGLEPHSDSVRVYGISLDPRAESRAYVEEKEISFPVLHFPDERLRELFHVTGVPITLVVGSGGTVKFVFVGSISRSVGVYTDSVVTAALDGRTSTSE